MSVPVMTVACPTICDDDCEVRDVEVGGGCHEWHLPRYKRDHQPEDCPRWTLWYARLLADAYANTR